MHPGSSFQGATRPYLQGRGIAAQCILCPRSLSTFDWCTQKKTVNPKVSYPSSLRALMLMMDVASQTKKHMTPTQAICSLERRPLLLPGLSYNVFRCAEIKKALVNA